MRHSRLRSTPTLHAKWWAVALIMLGISGGVGLWLHAGWRFFRVSPEAGWVPPHESDRWQCIVIHHSASDVGGAQRFDEWHRRRGWDGLGYDFVIGNGSDTKLGQVEVGPRWTAQKQGAHTLTDDEYYNQHGIGICLVGNFDNQPPDDRQMQSLVKLTRFLCQEFHIPPSRIYTHGGVTHKTDCPGKYFDVEKLRRLAR